MGLAYSRRHEAIVPARGEDLVDAEDCLDPARPAETGSRQGVATLRCEFERIRLRLSRQSRGAGRGRRRAAALEARNESGHDSW